MGLLGPHLDHEEVEEISWQDDKSVLEAMSEFFGKTLNSHQKGVVSRTLRRIEFLEKRVEDLHEQCHQEASAAFEEAAEIADYFAKASKTAKLIAANIRDKKTR